MDLPLFWTFLFHLCPPSLPLRLGQLALELSFWDCRTPEAVAVKPLTAIESWMRNIYGGISMALLNIN
jgi:hypothetical protein